jgi:serine phosphatase RsbU (regulator of sigma subunit)
LKRGNAVLRARGAKVRGRTPDPPTQIERKIRVLGIGTPERLGIHGAMSPVLELEFVGPTEAHGVVEASPFDAVLLDGGLPAARLKALLAELVDPGRGRPATVVMADPSCWSALRGALGGDADAFAETGASPQQVLDRIATALDVRRLKADLSRSSAQVEGLAAELAQVKLRMAEELRLAGTVQRSLHPPPRHHPRLDIGREFIPVRDIGGDYYDFVPLDAERLVFAVGDVMGKGMPAALLAANLKASLRAQLHSGDVHPEDLLSRVNRLFFEVTPKGRFSSLFVSVFRLDRGVLEYANAGHPPPFLVRPDGTLKDLDEGGTALGLVEDASYARGEVPLLPEDLLVFFSDGVTDRTNREGELFGLERLKRTAAGSRSDPARIALYSILGDLQGWSAGSPPEDDMTLIVTKVR